MKFQSWKGSCGPASLHNALAALGISRSEEEIIRLSGQKPEGTSSAGLVKAIKAISPSVEPSLVGEAVKWGKASDAEVGLWWFVSELGRPLILCVDKFEHWVACVGRMGHRFALVDSADNRFIIFYTAKELVERWAGPAESRYGFHAVVV